MGMKNKHETEKEVEEYLVKQVKKLGGKAYKFVSPGNVGVPDRLLVLPYNTTLFIEVKAPSGVLSKMQIKQHLFLREMGCFTSTVYSKSDVDALIEIIKQILERRKNVNVTVVRTL